MVGMHCIVQTFSVYSLGGGPPFLPFHLDFFRIGHIIMLIKSGWVTEPFMNSCTVGGVI